MNERQLELILDIIQEHLSDYLDDVLAAEIFSGIAEGINDNMPLLEELAEGRQWTYACRQR